MALPAGTVYITMRGAVLVFGDTLTAVTPPTYTGGERVECQIVSAAITASTVTETAPATLCGDEVDRTTGLKYSLAITAFQDYQDPAGLGWYLQSNALDTVFFSLALPEGGWEAGEVELIPLNYGGAAGANLQGDVTMGVANHQFTPPTAVGTRGVPRRARATSKAAAA